MSCPLVSWHEVELGQISEHFSSSRGQEEEDLSSREVKPYRHGDIYLSTSKYCQPSNHGSVRRQRRVVVVKVVVFFSFLGEEKVREFLLPPVIGSETGSCSRYLSAGRQANYHKRACTSGKQNLYKKTAKRSSSPNQN